MNTASRLKIATWNVNSLKVRLQHVTDWLTANPVDALCLQELKLPDEKFPLQAFTDMGYQACWAGQKTYNGVAIISREPLTDTQRNIPGFDDPQQRVIAGTLETSMGQVRLISAYCPNGQALDSDKYQYKLSWFKALEAWLAQELRKHPNLAILGDYNIAPADEDVHDPVKWKDDILVSPAERHAFSALLELGLTDIFRAFPQAPELYTWWDYRRFAFRRNAGLRIDHILLSDNLARRATSCIIDTQPRALEQPSDHAPVIASITL